MKNIKSQEVLRSLENKLKKLYEFYPEGLYCRDRSVNDWELCARGALTELSLMQTYSSTLNYPIIEEDQIEDVEIILDEITQEFLESNCCLPYRLNEDKLLFLIADPYDTDQLMIQFKKIFKLELEFAFVRRSVLEKLIQNLYSEQSEEDNLGLIGSDEESLRHMASEAKIVRLVNEMFSRAIEARASDIHIEPEENKYAIRFRIDGVLNEYLSGSLKQYPAVASRIKLVGGLNIAESRLPQDGRTNIKIGRSDIDIRINTIPTINGESIVLRLLQKDAMEFKLANMGMRGKMLDNFEKLIGQPHGIILVVGPTGSGKTTTLYSIMSQLNVPGKKIITVEDPVEYKTPRLQQIQVNHNIGLTFAGALRNIVRQDPDIILVSEIRDRETADISINAALTGHLVLSTLHTNDAAGAVSRLLDMGVENFLLTSSLIGVLSQRLVRKVCTTCSGKGSLNNKPCKACSGTGFKGRVGIFEFMPITDRIRNAVLDNKDTVEINRIAIEEGMVSLIDDGLAKVDDGITTKTEVLRVATDE